MLRVKLEEGEETFVQLPQHLICSVVPGESTAEVKSIQEPVTETICWSVAQSTFLRQIFSFIANDKAEPQSLQPDLNFPALSDPTLKSAPVWERCSRHKAWP